MKGSGISLEAGGSVTFDLTAEGELPRLERTADGKALVRAFSDLKRHDLCDQDLTHFCNEVVVQAGVPTGEFLTKRLWEVGWSCRNTPHEPGRCDARTCR